MSVQELKISEESYRLYMEGQKNRRRSPGLHISMDFGHSHDAMLQAIQHLKNIKFPNVAEYIIIPGGVGYGKTAMMEKMIRDLHQHNIEFIVPQGASKMRMDFGHSRIDFLTEGNSFLERREFPKLSDLKGCIRLPEKVQEDLPDETENWLAPEPPKQKKFRSYQPDKRALNRKNRKRK